MDGDVYLALVAYGLRLVGQATKEQEKAGRLVDDLPDLLEWRWEVYEELLGRRQSPEKVLSSIFSWVALPDQEGQRTLPRTAYYVARPLALKQETLFPLYVSEGDGKRLATQEEALGALDLPGLWEGFATEYKELWKRFRQEREVFFEAFYHLMYRYAWSLPCTYGEKGVSLFEQWKAVAALAFATGEKWADGPGSKFTLIGGDIPGIQDFVYTITSKGAAKGLRGRSFFLQLLGDAVVRRILADLELCACNVVYNAGGNFMLLGPEEKRAVAAVEKIRRQVNAWLVEAIQGETALVLEAMSVTPADLFTPDRFRQVRDDFAKEIARAKRQPLRELAVDEEGWGILFKPKDKGSELSCAVCRIEVDETNSKLLERTGEPAEGAERPRICYLCDSFAGLARDIRHEDLWMAMAEKPEMRGTEVQPKGGWAKLLARMTGFEYKFSDKPLRAEGIVLAINRPDFLKARAHGFRLVANVTPKTTEDDVNYLREEAKWEEKDIPDVDDIRSFTLLAHAAAMTGAIERVGVLRMDVDNLGRVFSEGVPDLTLPKLSALSGALDLFFGGYLNELVQAQAKNDLYIIYAGGDDLFIVGAWHHLPDLAESIRNQFKDFTGEHPALSLSGGITLEGAKFPLYRAAERAGEAEGRAKGYTRPDERRKDALCFLDTVVGWEDWDLVRQQKDNLLWLIGEDEENRARKEDERQRRLPRAVIQVVQGIYHLYRTGLWDARRRVRRKNRKQPADKKLPLPKSQVFYGRWAWMQAYSLGRLAQRSKDDEVKARIMDLQKALMQPTTVRYSGLAARWAEYLTRKEAR